MDDKGTIQLQEVECVTGEFNEGLTLSPYTPTVKLFDVYGAQNMESLGQCLNNETQEELYLVGLRAASQGKQPSIWLKHYKKGILTVDERVESDGEDGVQLSTKGEGLR